MAFLNFYTNSAELGSGTDSTLAGSFDPTYCDKSIRFANNSGGALIGPSDNESHPDVWFHMEVYGDSTTMTASSASGMYFQILTDGSRSIMCDLNNGNIFLGHTTNLLSFEGGVSTQIAVPWSTTRIALDIRMQVVSGGTDVCTLYVDGVETISATHANSTTGATKVRGMQWNLQDTNGNIYLSQIMVANEDTRGLKLCAMDADAAGANSAWVGDYTNIINDDGTFISSNTAEQQEDWNLAAYPGPASPTGIRVFQKSKATKGISGPTGVQHYLRIASTDYFGATHANPKLGNPVITEWATNPNTSAAWATADLASLIAGVKSIA